MSAAVIDDCIDAINSSRHGLRTHFAQVLLKFCPQLFDPPA
jgi:hypothetical protein